MTADQTPYMPPVHQTATFDQAYADISATTDELIAAFRNVRAENAASREIDIAGLVEYLTESPNDREQFIEHYVVAVVRLAEQEQQIREQVAAEIEARGNELRGDKEYPISREEWACFTIAASVARGEAR